MSTCRVVGVVQLACGTVVMCLQSLKELLQSHKEAALHIAADHSTLSKLKAEGTSCKQL